MVNFSLEGKVALVTGAAYGIGLAIARAYAEAGAKIVFNCSRQETVDRGMKAYKELGIDAKGYLCDVTDEEAVKTMVADIEKTVGTIDILVNNAGIIKRIPMEQMAVEDFRRVIDVDLVGSLYLRESRDSRYDQERSRKNYQHLLDDERTRSRNSIGIRRSKGRTQDAHPQYML